MQEAVDLIIRQILDCPQKFLAAFQMVLHEVLHALTYSDIVRQCLPNSREIIQEIQDNQEVLKRSGVIEPEAETAVA